MVQEPLPTNGPEVMEPVAKLNRWYSQEPELRQPKALLGRSEALVTHTTTGRKSRFLRQTVQSQIKQTSHLIVPRKFLVYLRKKKFQIDCQKPTLVPATRPAPPVGVP